jgi:hypothetical protein
MDAREEFAKVRELYERESEDVLQKISGPPPLTP